MSTITTSTFGTRMRLRALLVTTLVTGALASPMALASGTDRAVTSGWWWAAQTSPTATVPVPYGTGPGEVFVSRQGYAHEKAAAIRVDVSDLTAPPNLMVVALDEIPDSASEGPLSGDLLACPIVDTPWESAQGGVWSARPRGGCLPPGVSVGSRDDTGRWTFDITVMASGWVDGSIPNRGFEIFPTQHPQNPTFEVGLLAPDADDLYLLVRTAAAPAPPSPRLPVVSHVTTLPAVVPTREDEFTPPGPSSAPASGATPSADAAGPAGPTINTSITAAPASSSEPAGTPVAPILIALIACASAATSWFRVRLVLATRP